jgi:hypothetical protein
MCRRKLVTPRLIAGKLRSSSGSKAKLTAMRRASSWVSYDPASDCPRTAEKMLAYKAE